MFEVIMVFAPDAIDARNNMTAFGDYRFGIGIKTGRLSRKDSYVFRIFRLEGK
jgi:hypothetical protein